MRYEEKMNYIFQKITNLPEDLSSDLSIDALFYRLYTTIEAAMDIVAMLCKDFGFPVGDDYSNIECLEKEKTLSNNLVEGLKRLNSLRNVLVHRYNRIDTARVLNSVEEIQRILFEFVEVTEDLLQKIFGKD